MAQPKTQISGSRKTKKPWVSLGNKGGGSAATGAGPGFLVSPAVFSRQQRGGGHCGPFALNHLRQADVLSSADMEAACDWVAQESHFPDNEHQDPQPEPRSLHAAATSTRRSYHDGVEMFEKRVALVDGHSSTRRSNTITTVRWQPDLSTAGRQAPQHAVAGRKRPLRSVLLPPSDLLEVPRVSCP